MNQGASIVAYAGLYRAYVEVLNITGLKTGFKRKGGWQKATTFPYWDNWAWTHLAWGGFGALIGLTPHTMIALSLINEFAYEPHRCKQYAKGDKSIYYAQHCDPLGHKIADTLYTLVGYSLFHTSLMTVPLNDSGGKK